MTQISIHTVTAFLYCGLAGRGFWLTAIMAPRFLASAFSSGPAFLIILCHVIRKVSPFDPGREAIQALAKIATYGLLANLFFLGCELFVVFYSGIPVFWERRLWCFGTMAVGRHTPYGCIVNTAGESNNAQD